MNAITTINAINAINAANRTQAARLSGVALVPAGLCQYGEQVRAADLLRVDFDADSIRRDGLYLVEGVTDDGVAWMGCRRFSRGLDCALSVDDSGRGDWRDVSSLEAAGFRVAGYVEQVYRAV